MFTIDMREDMRGYAELSAKTETLEAALNFVRTFSIDGAVIVSSWKEHATGIYVMDVYDWCDCFCPDPPPMARITAPPGFSNAM